jgi:hypothetical protein
MKLKPDEIRRIAGQILKGLKERGTATFQAPEEKVQERVEGVILKNLEEEAAIEEEVKKIMEQYRSQIASGSIDPQKAYMMIKKQVAKERKFVL